MHVLTHLFVSLLSLSNPASPQNAASPETHGVASPSLGPKILGFRPQMRPMNFDVAKQLKLKPLRGGGYFYQGEEKERFDARIYPDGSVEFRESGAFELKADLLCFGVICPKATPKKPLLKSSKSKKDTRASRRLRKARKIATRVALGVLVGAIVSSGLDGSQNDSPWAGPDAGLGRPGSRGVGVFYTSGRFGRTGQLSIHKQSFLDRTRSFRLELAVTAQEAYMRRSLRDLSRALASIEKNKLSPPDARRARLVELWQRFDVHYEEVKLRDAIAQRLRASMGTKLGFARKQILAFARRVFPKGSKLQFTDTELREANIESTSDGAFLPY